MNHLKSKTSAREFKQVEQYAKDIITGAAALLPGGQVFDVANIVEDIVDGVVPLADGSGLAAGEGASAASDAIDKDLSTKSGSIKSKIISAVVGFVVGEATTEIVQPSQDIIENKGLPE
ncbi:MAG: hypothetical protein ABJK37_01290 [Paraglaciecola sp.]|uniref:hypothetical protein n=1 Tax=Paraglaciecola sp. TaxID=1920173 RepID=UPI003296C870